MSVTNEKHYTQFSKRIVVAVVVAVTAITAGGCAICYKLDNVSSMVTLIQSYITFATLVFAAYCGNSAIEKWAVKKYSSAETTTEEENG